MQKLEQGEVIGRGIEHTVYYHLVDTCTLEDKCVNGVWDNSITLDAFRSIFASTLFFLASKDELISGRGRDYR